MILIIVQELCESRGGRPGLSVLTSLLASVDIIIEPCSRIGLSLLLIFQPTSEDIKHHFIIDINDNAGASPLVTKLRILLPGH